MNGFIIYILMRVLHVINSLQIGGAERLIVELCPLLVEKSVEADVLILNDNKTSFYQELVRNGKNKVILIEGISLYNPLHIIKLFPIIKKYDLLHIHLFPALYWTFFASCLLY